MFTTSETVEIPVATTADRVVWSAHDFFGVEVAAGNAAVDAGRASIIIEPRIPGWFELEAKARAGEADVATARTTYAVVPPADTTAAVRDSPFGVMTHFAQGWDIDVIPLIARAGIRHVRDEQYWAHVERHRGEYRFPERLTRYMAELTEHGIEPLIVLSFANDLYDRGLTPFTDEGRSAYARYAQAVLKRYGQQIRAVEVWNEYNGSFCEGPCRDDRPSYYTRMLKRTYEAIDRVRPDVTVVGGAAVTIPLPYFEAIFQAGGLDYMDAVAVHPYGSTPDGVAREIAGIERLMAHHADDGPKPIWVTEVGDGGASPAGRREAARYLVRMYTALLSAGVERVYWYLLRDYGGFTGMGLLQGPDSDLGRYAPAPAYVAYANLIHQLGRARFVRRGPTDPRTRVYLFNRAGEEVRVAWSSTPPARLRLETDHSLVVIDIMGRPTTRVPEGGAVELIVGDNPVYIVGRVRRIEEGGRNELLADSVEGYSDQQGQAGWFYGQYDGDGVGEGNGIDPDAYTNDDFEPLKRVTDRWSHKWGDGRYAWLSIGPRGAHPSHAEKRPVWAVRRWISDVSGTVRLSGRITNDATKGDGAAARILVDGRTIFATEIGGPDHPHVVGYEIEVTLHQGSLVDFAVTPGPQRNINFDSSQFTARITRDRP